MLKLTLQRLFTYRQQKSLLSKFKYNENVFAPLWSCFMCGVVFIVQFNLTCALTPALEVPNLKYLCCQCSHKYFTCSESQMLLRQLMLRCVFWAKGIIFAAATWVATGHIYKDVVLTTLWRSCWIDRQHVVVFCKILKPVCNVLSWGFLLEGSGHLGFKTLLANAARKWALSTTTCSDTKKNCQKNCLFKFAQNMKEFMTDKRILHNTMHFLSTREKKD